MPYFTSWDINVFLCLVTWGIPVDVVKGMLKKVKETNRSFCFKRDREWHCIRMSIVRYMGLDMLFRVNCHMPVITEYKERLSVIDPEGKYGYYVWAYENFWYKSWNCHPSKRLLGFHPGRFFLMDLRRGVYWMDIRDLEENAAENAAWEEERFIRGKDYIDTLIEKTNVHRMKEKVLREIISL